VGPGYRDAGRDIVTRAPQYRDAVPGYLVGPGYRDAGPGYRDTGPGYRDAGPGYRDEECDVT